MVWLRLFSVAIVLWGATTPARAAPPPDEGLDAEVQALMTEWAIPGLALAVVKDGKVVLARGYGVRQAGAPERVNADTIFGVGSMTKSFTALAAALMVDEGKLDWDRPASGYVKGLAFADPWLTGHVTLRDLAAHRVGVDSNVWMYRSWSTDETLKRIPAIPPAGPYGGMLYSNTGILALGKAVEAASGQSWDEVLRRRIFEPLGMARSDVAEEAFVAPRDLARCWLCAPPDGARLGKDALTSGERNVASPHGVRAEAMAPPGQARRVDLWPWRYEPAITPAGAVNSTANDMARYLLMHLSQGRPLISAGQWAEIHRFSSVQDRLKAGAPTNVLEQTDQIDGLGLGWRTKFYRGHRVSAHSGGQVGYGSTMWVAPDDGLGVVILTNLDYRHSLAQQGLARRIVDRFLGLDPIDWDAWYRARWTARHEGREVDLPAAQPLSKPASAYAGRWRSPLYGDVTVTAERKGLVLRFEASSLADLHPAGPDRFVGVMRSVEQWRVTVDFEGDRMVLGRGGGEIGPAEFTRVAGPDPVVTRSVYIPMADGVRLAADIHLPRDAEGPLPTVLLQTPYHRGGASPNVRSLVERGYAYVAVDVRGSGASFGSRATLFGPREIADGKAVIDWIVRQPWSNGRVGLEGVSYNGTAGELVLASGHPAIKALMPQFATYDAYPEIIRPGGLFSDRFARVWSDFTKALDNNQGRRSVGPVDGDQAALVQAVADHQKNFDPYAAMLAVRFKDDKAGAFSPVEMSPWPRQQAIRATRTPILSVSGWYDGAYAYGAIKRFLTTPNPGSRLIIGPWDHGGRQNVSPCARGKGDTFNSQAESARFFDRWLKGEKTADEAPVRYFTMCAEAWRSARTWPPEAVQTTFHLGPGHRLVGGAGHGADDFAVDHSASSGKASRWVSYVNVTGARIGYPDRAGQKGKVIAWESAPLERDTEVTGHPLAKLQLSADRPQAQIFVYLEDVGPSGEITYVTEGQLDLIHRRLSMAPAPYRMVTPYRTFARADARPLVPGEKTEAVIDLWPTSFLFRKGHRVRLSIAGADADNFEVPKGPAPILRVFHTSSLTLPVVSDPRP